MLSLGTQIIKKPLTRFVCCSCEHVVRRSSQAFAKHSREMLGGLEMGKRTLPLCHSHRGLGWLGNDKQKFVTLVRWRDSPVHLRDPWSSARAYSFNLWRHIRERRKCLKGRWRGGPVWYMTACKIRASSLLPCSNPCDIASSVLQ